MYQSSLKYLKTCSLLYFFWVLSACSESDYNTKMVNLFVKGNEELKQKNYKLALYYYDQGIKLDSSLADIFSNRGLVYFNMGEYDKALRDYNRALSMKPDLYDTYFNRVALYQETKDYKACLSDLDKLTKAFPDSLDLWFGKAKANLEIKDYQSSLETSILSSRKILAMLLLMIVEGIC